MKYLLVTDTHLGIYGDSEIWHNVAINLFNQIYDTCMIEEIDAIVHLGDFFHNRKTLNTKTQEISHEICDILKDQTVYIIVGNHDCYYRNKTSPTSLKFLNKYNNINIVSKSSYIDDETILVPWGGELHRARYCMGHLQISGFYMNDSFICKSGNDITSFHQYEKVFSGHFHTPSIKNNVNYIGSAYQQTNHDIGSTRGYYIFDTESSDLKFIPNTQSPKFIKIKPQDINEKTVKGNVITLIFDKDYGTSENEGIIDEVSKLNPIKLNVDFSNISYEDEEIIIDQESTSIDNEEILIRYIKEKSTPPENVKKHMLLEIIMKLTGEIKNE